METLILSPLSPTVLIAIGVLFIALEALVMSFVVIWFKGRATVKRLKER